MIIVGLMSGTSADGVDAAVVELHGIPPYLRYRVLSHSHILYPIHLKDEIYQGFNPKTGNVELLSRLNFSLGSFYGEVALEAISAAGLNPQEVDLIGSHGQTFWHIPGDQVGASTLQLGEAAIIAEKTGITVVSNFRSRDMAAGGHGAPLVSYADYLFFSDATKAIAAQNIGGIGNVTYLPPQQGSLDGVVAFDTGPGNMLIDYFVQRTTNGALMYDKNGELAKKGQIDGEMLAYLMEEPYLKKKPPKTTGRELFGEKYGENIWQKSKNHDLSSEDMIATLTAFTAKTIEQAYHLFLPTMPEKVVVHGGGALNPVLMTMLSEYLHPAQICTSMDYGMPVEAKEAIAFAVLAYETWHGRPGNVPSATGARSQVILGDITVYPDRVNKSHIKKSTEAVNQETVCIDLLPTEFMLQVINIEDHLPAKAVHSEIPKISEAVDSISKRMNSGGRLVYVGAGTAGRLGVIDAAECPVTFNADPDQVIGILAGGKDAFESPFGGAEDDGNSGKGEIRNLNINPLDCVVGITASGNTPFVVDALIEAKHRGALVIGIVSNRLTRVHDVADITITLIVGPEVIAGSTRLKAGTAQKMTLNMLSTALMIRLGKTYGNLMIDLQPSNKKLISRLNRIVAQACEISDKEAEKIIEACDGEAKTAIVHYLANIRPEQARRELKATNGSIRKVLKKYRVSECASFLYITQGDNLG